MKFISDRPTPNETDWSLVDDITLLIMEAILEIEKEGKSK